jgi:hypothetical protein
VAFALTPALFVSTNDPALLLPLVAVNAFFCQGLFSWMPVWLPELFPTHLRATAIAFADDRAVRWLRPNRNADFLHLHSRLPGYSITARDERKAAARPDLIAGHSSGVLVPPGSDRSHSRIPGSASVHSQKHFVLDGEVVVLDGNGEDLLAHLQGACPTAARR